MEKTILIAKSFAEADEVDKAFYRALTPLERLEIFLELNRRWPADDAQATDRIQRVYRIVENQ